MLRVHQPHLCPLDERGSAGFDAAGGLPEFPRLDIGLETGGRPRDEAGR